MGGTEQGAQRAAASQPPRPCPGACPAHRCPLRDRGEHERQGAAQGHPHVGHRWRRMARAHGCGPRRCAQGECRRSVGTCRHRVHERDEWVTQRRRAQPAQHHIAGTVPGHHARLRRIGDRGGLPRLDHLERHCCVGPAIHHCAATLCDPPESRCGAESPIGWSVIRSRACRCRRRPSSIWRIEATTRHAPCAP